MYLSVSKYKLMSIIDDLNRNGIRNLTVGKHTDNYGLSSVRYLNIMREIILS